MRPADAGCVSSRLQVDQTGAFHSESAASCQATANAISPPQKKKPSPPNAFAAILQMGYTHACLTFN